MPSEVAMLFEKKLHLSNLLSMELLPANFFGESIF